VERLDMALRGKQIPMVKSTDLGIRGETVIFGRFFDDCLNPSGSVAWESGTKIRTNGSPMASY